MHETVGKALESCGFKFRKTDFTYKKKSAKDFVHFVFIFHDYHPIHYEVKFHINEWNDRIQQVKSKLLFEENLMPTNWSSLQMPLGDFIEIEQGKAIKWRIHYHFYLHHRKHLEDAAAAMGNILLQTILPLCNELLTIDGINDLFASRGVQWSLDSLNINNVTANLISAAISGRRNYHIVYTEIIQAIIPMLNNGYPSSARKAIEAVYDYLKNDSMLNRSAFYVNYSPPSYLFTQLFYHPCETKFCDQ